MISGGFGFDFIVPMPMIRVSINLLGITTDFVALDFLLDTGSTNTCLHPRDATVNLGLPWEMLTNQSAWSRRAVTAGIAGVATYFVQPAVYLFHHDDGKVQQLARDIQVAVPTTSNERLPSLLGMDILRNFRLSMDYLEQRLVLE